MSTRVLVLGSGGREHALAWRLGADAGIEVLVAPGNDYIAGHLQCRSVNESDPADVVALARRESVDLVVVGGEAPLAAGVVDALAAAKIAAYGPTKGAAMLESSKAFAKEVMRAAGVPTPAAEIVTTMAEAERSITRREGPYVVKADGLAAGKGVRVTPDRSAALRFASECLDHHRFGASGERILIEDFVVGPEISLTAVCDGVRFVMLPPTRDHKRAQDGDLGPNTGGMGAYAPVADVDHPLEQRVSDFIISPTLSEMAGRGKPFRGTLYVGLVLSPDGPRVLEFNARFGDPETEAMLPLLRGEFAELLRMASGGELTRLPVARTAGATVAVALVDESYPDPPRAHGRIEGLEEIEDSRVRVFGAALVRDGGGWRITGGRAAFVVAHDESVVAARERAYAAIRKLSGTGWRCRTDIAAGEVPVAGAATPHGTEGGAS